MIYQAGEQVPIGTYITRTNGRPDTNESPNAFIINVDTGQIVINQGNVTQIFDGFYRYIFTPSVTIDTTFLWFFKEGNLAGSGDIYDSGYFRIVTTKQQLTDTIDLDDGRAI